MRRVSRSLISVLGKTKNASPNLPKILPSLVPVPPISSPLGSHGPLPLPSCPSRGLQTISNNAPAVLGFGSRQRKHLEDQSELEEAFESAATTDEILAAFAALESSLHPDDNRLGLACLKVGQHLDAAGDEDDEKVLAFGLRALRILDTPVAAATAAAEADDSISVAMALHLVGSASYNLKRFNDSLGFLNRANRILIAMEADGCCKFDVRPVSHAVQLQLANTKTAMGRREEALVNLRRCLDLKVSILGPNSQELGAAYRDLAEAYAAILNFNEALPLCLKALEIHQGQLGQNSVEVAHDRRLLGVIYTGLEEHEKALEHNQISQKIFKSWGMGGSDLRHAEIDAANIQIAMGKHDEAINTLKGLVQQTDEEDENRALVLVLMAKVMCHQEKTADAKRCLEVSRSILEKKESTSPAMVAESYTEISSLYETMNDFQTAIALLKKSLAMVEKIPQEQHIEGNISAKIGWLLLLTGKVNQAVPYLESAAERMKESFGPKHFGVGYIYNNLGAAYMEMDRSQSAAQMFALAKDIMDVSLGPHHADTIETLQSLANAYNSMGSYPLALEFQQKVVDAWAGHGAKDQVKEASRILEQIKRKAFEALQVAVCPDELQSQVKSVSALNMRNIVEDSST